MEMPTVLPGVAPTGRKVELPHVVVMGIENGKVVHEHIYWDQGSLLAQVGLIDPDALPVTGHSIRNCHRTSLSIDRNG
jgi:carboxymethylenebutenolidase